MKTKSYLEYLEYKAWAQARNEGPLSFEWWMQAHWWIYGK